MLTVAKSAFTHVSIVYADRKVLNTSGVKSSPENTPPDFHIFGTSVTTYKKWYPRIDFMGDISEYRDILANSSPESGLIFTEMVKIEKGEPVDIKRNILQFMWLKPEFKIRNNLNKKSFADEQVRGRDFPEDRLTMRFYSGNVTL